MRWRGMQRTTREEIHQVSKESKVRVAIIGMGSRAGIVHWLGIEEARDRGVVLDMEPIWRRLNR